MSRDSTALPRIATDERTSREVRVVPQADYHWILRGTRHGDNGENERTLNSSSTAASSFRQAEGIRPAGHVQLTKVGCNRQSRNRAGGARVRADQTLD